MVNWSGLSELERTDIVPALVATNNWILITHLLGQAKCINPPFLHGARRILLAKGNASREKRLWKTDTHRLASHRLDTEVWVSLKCCTSSEQVLALEELLNSESLKDLPDMRADGIEDTSWPGTGSSLIGIPQFLGVVYATLMDHTVPGAWEQVSIATTPKEAAVATLVEALGGLLG